jgi:hypothetical protein
MISQSALEAARAYGGKAAMKDSIREAVEDYLVDRGFPGRITVHVPKSLRGNTITVYYRTGTEKRSLQLDSSEVIDFTR